MISFGVEFEFDYIDRNNRVITFSGETPGYLSRGWDYQNDMTASVELRTPVMTSLEQFIEECNKQFNGLIEQEFELIPYMCNSDGRSLGQHVHIGLPNRALTSSEKYKIAKAIIKFYPMLASIHAQPIPSRRGLTTVYALSMSQYMNVISDDHYAEISDSHHGTIEFRIFDANIPQTTLTCVYIMRMLAEKALTCQVDDVINFSEYNKEREKALRYGLIALNITKYLKELKNMIGNVEIPNIPALRQILYLMAKRRMNPYNVMQYLNVKPSDYMRNCLKDVSKYLDNLIECVNNSKREKVKKWIEEANEIENLDQLIGLSINVDERLSSILTNAIIDRSRGVNITMSRREVREAIGNLSYRFSRIREVYNIDEREVARRVSELLTNHGDGYCRALSESEVINCEDRFYVLTVMDRRTNRQEIVGAISIKMSRKEITNVVVDRRYRRLGIARVMFEFLIEIMRRYNLGEIFAVTHVNNTAYIRLLESLGFTLERRDGDVLTYKITISR